MHREIPESDWKKYKRIYELALERYYTRALDSIKKQASDLSLPIRERYISTYKLVREQDKLIDIIFASFSRSGALRQLSLMYVHRLISDEELSTFSEEVQTTIKRTVQLYE